MKIKAVLFDFDGTLTEPGALDFAQMRNAIGCPLDQFILEFIESLPSSARKVEAMAVLDRIEIEAAADSKPNAGAEDLIEYLRLKDLSLGILSRNNLQSIERALDNFDTIGVSDFQAILSRDEPVRPKPSADGVLLAAQRLKVDVRQMLVVGDFLFDIQAGQRAGAVTVFLDNPANVRPVPDEADYAISCLDELKAIVRPALPLPAGKLPNDLLETYLDEFGFIDPSVLIKPGVGEDTAAVDVEDAQVLVVKSDPITFVTESVGHYAVLINANDIATSGATPRWLLTTLLFPCGVTASEIRQVMCDLYKTCLRLNITLCGGHTEITDAVTRPVVTGMLAGTVAKENLIDKRNIRSGDRILLTKAVAVEGTAIVSMEFGGRLKQMGMPETEIETCRQFLSRISVLEEAKIASRSNGVSAMHDITEGGIATAAVELSAAGSHRIRIDMDKIHVFPETESICRLLGLNPLGLIGSGSLLICCKENACESLMADIHSAGIEVTCIGEVLEKGRGIEAVKQGRQVEWPCFEADELTRLF